MSEKVPNYPIFPTVIQPDMRYESIPVTQLPQHSHGDWFEWFFAASGGGVQAVGAWTEEVATGDLLVIPPGENHVFAPAVGGCVPIVLFMRREDVALGGDGAKDEACELLDFWRSYVRNYGYRLRLEPQDRSRGGKIMRRVYEIAAQPVFGDAVRIRGLLLDLLLLAFKLDRPPQRHADGYGAPCDFRIKNILYYLDHNFNRKITVEELLQQASMSRSSFHRCFLKATGMSLSQYLNRLRVNSAERLIADGMSCEEAARQSGFFSRSNFFQQKRIYHE